MATAIEHIAAKLQRAKEHIGELQRESDAFLNEAPQRAIRNDDPDTAKAFEEVHRLRIVPPRLSVITGETVYQLRSSLDHLVCALILKEFGTLTLTSQFPIFSHRPTKTDEIRRYAGQIEGIRHAEVRAIIEGYQPYMRGERRGGHWLAILKALSNMDKHRRLLVHVTQIDHMKRTKSVIGSMRIEQIGPDDGTHPTTGPLPGGDFITVLDSERHLTTRVAFDEWGDTGQAVSIDSGLLLLREGVADVVGRLVPFLS